jgi:predicted transposase YbfD/YdcC
MKSKQFFDDVPDFRKERKKLYDLRELLMIALCAILSGAEDFEEIAEYGVQKLAFLRTFLELPNGIASHDTFNRVFKHLDKEQFAASLYKWSKELLGFLVEKQIAIDGKVLCGTDRSGSKKSGICIVSAWAQTNRLTLGQVKVDEKSNEKTAIPQLLDSLELCGSVVSIDAMGCQPSIAEQIRGKKGDYFLAVKGNQGELFEEAKSRFRVLEGQLETFEQTDFVGGRIEKRICTVMRDLTLVDSAARFMDSKSLVRIEAHRTLKNHPDKTAVEMRYYLASFEASAARFLDYSKNHWAIENHLHWMLDVVFHEDQSRTRTLNAAENLTTLRKIALQLLYQADDNASMKKRRHKAAWNNEYLLNLLKPLF